MGLVRDRTFARTFGAGSELDVYNAALILPELVLDVLVIAGLSAAFVPIFARLRITTIDAAHRGVRADGPDRLGRCSWSSTVGILFVVAAADRRRSWRPASTPSSAPLYTELFRIMCVTAIIFAASFALGEMLVVRQRFLAYGLAPVLYNAGIVLGAVLLSPALGILGAAIGTVIGALLHLGVRVARDRAHRLPLPARAHAALIRASASTSAWRSRGPSAQPIEPLTFLYFTSVASTLAAGSISAVSFARNFQSVPVSLIGVAFSVAAFPVMASAARRRRSCPLHAPRDHEPRDHHGPHGRLPRSLSGARRRARHRGCSSAARPSMPRTCATTTMLLGAFALSVPLEAVTQLLARAIYSTRDTILPVTASLAGLIVTVGAWSLLADRGGIVALPLGFAAGLATRLGILLVALLLRVRTVGATTRSDDAAAGPRPSSA